MSERTRSRQSTICLPPQLHRNHQHRSPPLRPFIDLRDKITQRADFLLFFLAHGPISFDFSCPSLLCSRTTLLIIGPASFTWYFGECTLFTCIFFILSNLYLAHTFLCSALADISMGVISCVGNARRFNSQGRTSAQGRQYVAPRGKAGVQRVAGSAHLVLTHRRRGWLAAGRVSSSV